MSAPLQWLTQSTGPTTFGVPWPRGQVTEPNFLLLDDDGAPIPVQSWVNGYWPDGSIKWSAHAINPALGGASGGQGYSIAPAFPQGAAAQDQHVSPEMQGGEASPSDAESIQVHTVPDGWEVQIGECTWQIPASGHSLIREQRVGQRVVGKDLRVISRIQNGPDSELSRPQRVESSGIIRGGKIELAGPLKTIIKLEGDHGVSPWGKEAWLPFVVRLAFYAGSATVQITHSFIYTADNENEFLAGLGLAIDVPLADEPYNRHIRLGGEEGAFLAEAVLPITGLRRDPGEAFRKAQVAGNDCGPTQQWATTVSGRLHLIPQWNDWQVRQHSPDGFTAAKRTAADRPWITIPAGGRSSGIAYVGGVSGGVGLGLRDFWKLYPTGVDVRNAASEQATAIMWLYSPDAPVMDLRFYHDGLGQDTFEEQLDALEITYEDYEPDFGDSYGISRSHELQLTSFATTPSHAELQAWQVQLNDPPQLLPSAQTLLAAQVFGRWAREDHSTPERAEIASRLAFLFDYYQAQIAQRRWYGFWDYGDVMHTYDEDRAQWRYDIGGYAWDNSELSTDLWLWYYFLYSGRADAFRVAEAMIRHTGEVDVYHAGRWAGLGTRHNVQHFGCSAKQLRISTAAYRRIYYFLTADPRVGDLLDEQARAEETFTKIDPTRKVRTDVYQPDPAALAVGLGTDYGALIASWLTEWERFGDAPRGQAARTKLLGTMADIGKLPQGFFTGEALYDLATGRFDTSRDQIRVSHLSSVFGLPELVTEIIDLTRGTSHEVADFERAWLRYCRFYLASEAEQVAEFGERLQGISLVQAHSRLTAWAAVELDDPELAQTAWRKFYADEGDQLNMNMLQRTADWRTQEPDLPSTFTRGEHAPFVSTNDAAQYGLAAIQNLALIGHWHPQSS